MGKKDELVGLNVTVSAEGVPVEGTVGERPDDAHPGEAVPMPVPRGGWPADEYTGKGGSYVRDPFTGIRTPTAETLAAWAAAEAAEAEAAAAAARLKAELE